MNDLYFINIKDSLHWKILPDKMKIENVETQKAILNYGGRNWMAWFSSSISLQEGPYVFHGLPGLIVKISDDKGDYTFDLIQTKKSSKNNMFDIRKGKEISWEDLKKMKLSYYSDPFSQVKALNVPMRVEDENGIVTKPDMRNLTLNIQKQMKENNNPIEILEAVKYP